MELTGLMAAFAAKLGIDGVEVKDGGCALSIDGVPVEIAETQDGLHLVTSARVGTPPLEKTADFLGLILEANAASFALQDVAFGKLPDSGELVLQWRLPTQGVELESFCTGLEALLNQVEQWRQAIEGFGFAADEAAVMEADAPVFGRPDSGFMQV